MPSANVIANKSFKALSDSDFGKRDVKMDLNHPHMAGEVNEIDVFCTLISDFWCSYVWIDVLCATKNRNTPVNVRNIKK